MFERWKKNRKKSKRNNYDTAITNEHSHNKSSNNYSPEDSILKFKGNNGEDIEIEVLDIIQNDELHREYMVYRIRGTDDVCISIINETETTFSLDEITDENEFNEIEETIPNIV